MNGPSKPYKKLYKEAKTKIMRPKQTIEIQESRMQGQESRIRALERRLAYYDNASTPPPRGTPGRRAGRRQRRLEGGDGKKAGRPRGAPAGHRGATRRPRPARLGTRTPEACPRCGSGDPRVTGTNYRDITGMPPPEAVTTRHEINACAQRVREKGHPAAGQKLRPRRNLPGGAKSHEAHTVPPERGRGGRDRDAACHRPQTTRRSATCGR